MTDTNDRTWFILREPGKVPERKGPFRATQVREFLIELFDARPTALVTVLSIVNGYPDVQDGPECLEMIDGRYRARAARHRANTDAAWRTPR